MSAVGRSVRLGPPWLEFLEGSLAQVEAILHEEVSSPIRAIESMCTRSLEAGGKRLRPALVILGALACDSDADVSRPVRLGAAVELLHLATLIHDDVVDGAESRRGTPSANAVYGNKVSVLVGDYLLARAFRILANDGDSRIFKRMADVGGALSEGEILELVMRGTLGELESLYWQMIKRKTSKLLAACLEVGSISIGASEPEIEALASFGECLGLVFQITDDLLDLTGDRASVGKPVGADLLDGKVTLPYILALREIPSEVAHSILEKVFNRGIQPDDVKYATARALSAGVPERCLKLAEEQLDMALRHLSHLPSTPAKAVLEDIGPYLLTRSF